MTKSNCVLVGGPSDGAVYTVDDDEKEILIGRQPNEERIFKRIYSDEDKWTEVVKYERVRPDRFLLESLKGKYPP